MKALNSFFSTRHGVVMKDLPRGAGIVIKWQDRARRPNRSVSAVLQHVARGVKIVGGLAAPITLPAADE